MPELTNPRAERVRSVRALAGRSVRERRGRFLVEGPQSVRELTRFRAGHVDEVFLTDDAATRYPEILAASRAAGLPVRTGTREVLDAMSDDAQGVLAVARVWEASATALPDRVRLVAVLATVRDPGNAGTVIRVADAAGADAVVLAGRSVDLFNPKVVRSTAGSLFHLPVLKAPDLETALTMLRAAGCAVLAADGAGSHDLDDLLDRCHPRRSGTRNEPVAGVPDLAAPTAWLFGNEAHGLSDAERAMADVAVRVPLHGAAESLNLATAAAVCLYASARAHR